MPVEIAAYSDPAINKLYNLLFADDQEAFEVLADQEAAQVAVDDSAESRLRAVAYRKLAKSGQPVAGEPPLLGTIVEIGLDEGLDTLAAYADGSVRYFNHAGGGSLIEPGTALQVQAAAVLLASKAVVAAIGPWEGERLPPPPAGQARLTFLTGGQLYFGQGPFGALAADALAGPVLAAATTLLSGVVALSTAGQAEGEASS